MKLTSRVACITLFACATIPVFGDAGAVVYLRSDINQPWGQDTNEDALDAVFGPGNWTTMYYEDLNGNSIFAESTQFIFMEGGDSSFAAFQNFVENNGDNIYTWVRNGGRLLIMSAPNDPLTSATLYLPDNIVLHSDAFYESAASSAFAINFSHPIFLGPNPTAYNFTGDFVAHGYFTGTDLQPIMQSNLNEIVLGQDVIGNGLMVFGGLTTDNFHSPQPAAHFLLENIITYLANAVLQ
jgi:hypothetical protein